jgi:hypothetical protein
MNAVFVCDETSRLEERQTLILAHRADFMHITLTESSPSPDAKQF